MFHKEENNNKLFSSNVIPNPILPPKQKSTQKIMFLPKNYAYENKLYVNNKHGIGKTFIAEISSPSLQVTTYYPVEFSSEIPDEMTGISTLVCNKMQLGLPDDPKVRLISIENLQKKALDSLDLEIILAKSTNNSDKINFNLEKLTQIVLLQLKDYPIFPGQILALKCEEMQFVVKVKQVNSSKNHLVQSQDIQVVPMIDPETKININSVVNNLLITSKATSNLPKTFTLDFSTKGVGGLKAQIEKMINNIFLPRAVPIEMAEKYGEQHNSKGILLYGPPGTGKTLIARTIGEFFSKDKVKVINGPELMNKYVGESPKKLREQFADAIKEWQEKGPASDLHVLIFDEIDAIVPVRQSEDGTNAKNDMVATFLTLLDGVDSPKNIIVIGTTNRKDLIDPALLRPGRLDNVLEIGLPNEEARYEILKIHTNKIETTLLDKSVDLQHWVKLITNYTGAEIEQLINIARHYAMAGNFKSSQGETGLLLKDNMNKIDNYQKITHEHFEKAYQEIIPMFGVDKQIRRFKQENYVIYNQEITEIVNDFIQSTTEIKSGEMQNKPLTLIYGENGTGKTTLATYLAKQSDAKYIKILSSDHLLSFSLEKQIKLIEEEFENLQRAQSGVLILDDLENLIGANAELLTYNNILRLKFTAMIKNIQESNKNAIVIATGSDETFLKRVKLHHLFNEIKEVHPIVLDYSLDSQKTMRLLCESMGYQIEIQDNNKPNISLELPIRDLIYKIKKFCSLQGKKNTLDIDKFYDVLQPNSQISQKKDPILSPYLSTSLFSRHEKKNSENIKQQKKDDISLNL